MLRSNKNIVVSLVILILIIPVIAQEKSNYFVLSKDPYLGRKLPGLTPEIFAPGIISSSDHRELGGCTFSTDGKEFYFTRSIKNDWVIMTSRLGSKGWTLPEPFKISEGFTALEPHITFDNRRIFWVWRGLKDKGMYMAERTPDGWSEALYVGPGMMVSSDRSGQMFVTDTRLQPSQVVNVQTNNGRFTQYNRLKGEIEQFQNENRTAHPCVSPDGSYIIFDKNGTSLYVSFRISDNEWGKPIDLTKHKFHSGAGIASISPDGKYLFYGEKDDIYWVSTKIIKELKPIQLK